MNPTDAVTRALELSFEHRWDEAIEILEAAARDHPDDPDLPLELATYHIDRGWRRPDRLALADFDAADRRHPSVRADAGRAAVLARLGELERAEPFLRSALDHESGEPETLQALAELRFRQGRLDEALQAAKPLAAFAPGAALLARILELAGRRDDSWKVLQAAIGRVDDDDRFLVAVAAMREAQEDLDAARRALVLAADVNPLRAEASLALALLELRQDREGPAREALKEALRRDPDGTRESIRNRHPDLGAFLEG